MEVNELRKQKSRIPGSRPSLWSFFMCGMHCTMTVNAWQGHGAPKPDRQDGQEL